MSLFILADTPAGHALFKAKDKKLLKRTDLYDDNTAEAAAGLFKIRKFSKFSSAENAVAESMALGEGKVTPMLQGLLEEITDEKKASVLVPDTKLGNAIGKLSGLNLTAIADSSNVDVYRMIREHLTSLIPAIDEQQLRTMSLGLSHSMSRHKLKFSPDKVDTMIIQAIALLDDLDKEINQFAMRVKEWYGWHFPEMATILNDNYAFARVVIKMRGRENASATDLADILPEDTEQVLKDRAETSMGTEMTDEDMDVAAALAQQYVEYHDYREQLQSYLGARMEAIAPNLTLLVGDLVGARLIAHAGSLVNLAKAPASTIQILGAEKALFRALKTKHDTPKYGLIYHASLVGQASGKNKGKMARMLSSKTALGTRVDSLSSWGVEGEGDQAEPEDSEKVAISSANRAKLERRLRAMEGRPLGPRSGVGIGPNGQSQSQPGKFSLKETRKYNTDADGLANGTAKASKVVEEVNGDEDEDMEDADSDEDEEVETPAKPVNGLANGDDKAAKKAAKAQHKAEKAARKAERQEKRAAKEAKKAAKAAQANGESDGKKKRKHSEDGEKSEKKKKKKTQE